MKRLFYFLTALLFLPTIASAETTDDQYTTALSNVANGIYRIYAEVNDTKYYLKDSRTDTGNEVDFVTATMTQGEATIFAISQVEQSGGLVSKPWLIESKGYCFTNPSGGSASTETFTAGTCFRGYLISKRTNVCDRQVLYYNGSAYAVRSTNKSDGYWGGNAYWGISNDGNATYVTEASYIWHFEAVGGVTELTSGKYLIKGANASWAGKDSEPYWINDSKNMFCLWNDVKQATTFDVVCGDGVVYFYDSANKKYLAHNGSAWFSTPNTATGFYSQTQTYGGATYFALATESKATFGTDSKFCTAETSSTGHSRTVDGYSYSFTGFGCTDGSGKKENETNPDALWSFVESGNSSSTTFDLSTLQKGAPGLVAALKHSATGNVSYTLTVTDAGAATLCLPYTATIPSGVSAYTLAFEGNVLKATGTEGTLPANTPVLVMANAGSYTFSAACNTIADAVAPPTKDAMTGLFESKSGLTDGYVLQKKNDALGFYKINGSHAIGAFRAYIPTSAVPSSANARGFKVIFDGGTTDIQTIDQTQSLNNDCYNLSGQRVSQPKKGVYIVNGKKIVIR